jgi:hypothetical protein
VTDRNGQESQLRTIAIDRGRRQSEAGDSVELLEMQEALVTASEAARLRYALLLARWYCHERDRASEAEYLANQWQICACIWASVGILACTAVLVLIVRG